MQKNISNLEKVGFSKINLLNANKLNLCFLKFIKDEKTSYDYVINCTGLGARELCSDNRMYPVRGQVLRV